MKVLLDLNLWIDIAARPQSFPESEELFRSLQRSAFEVCLPLCGYTTIFYLINEILGHQAATHFTLSLSKSSVRMLPFSEREVALAHSLNFKDHEDACIAATALAHHCRYIATRNIQDFRSSPVKALRPKELLKKLHKLRG